MNEIINQINWCESIEEIRDIFTYNENIDVNYQDRRIFECIFEKNIECVKYFIEYCEKKNIIIDIHANNEHCFRHVCGSGTIEVVKYLIEYCEIHNNRINIHACSEEAFNNACTNGQIEIAQYLIEYGEKNNTKIDIHIENDIIFINSYEHVEIIKLLIEYSIKNNKKIKIHSKGDILLYNACRNNNLELVKCLVKYSYIIKKKYKTSIYKKYFDVACLYCTYNISLIKYMLNNRQSMYNFESSFINICMNGNLTAMKYLIEYINKKKIQFDIGKHKTTIFMDACSSCKLENIKYIIEYYESTNNKIIETSIIENGYISLVRKLYNNDMEIIKYLFEYCKRNNIKININNKYAWENMKRVNNLQLMIYILEYSKENNIEPNINNLNYYLFDVACSVENVDIIKYIVRYNKEHNNILDINGYIMSKIINRIRNVEIIEYLVEYSISINNKIDLFRHNSKFINACMDKNSNMLKYLINCSKNDNIIIKINYDEILNEMCKYNNHNNT